MKQEIEGRKSLIGLIAQNKGSKLLHDCSDDEIKQALAKIFLLVGLRKQHFPNGFELDFIVSNIRKLYAHRTIFDLTNAFELGLRKEIDVELNCYDQFTLIYLSNIMDAYRKYLVNAYNELPVEQPKQIEYKMTKEEKLADIEDFGTTECAFSMIPGYIYDWIIDLGLVTLSEDDKTEYYRRAIQMRESELKANAESGDVKEYNSFMKMKKSGFADITKAEINNIEFNYKRIVVREYYRNK